MTKPMSIGNDLTDGKVLNKLVKFAWPILLAKLLQALYSLADTLIVGQFDGSIGISAVTIGSQISYFLTTVGMGFAEGGQIIISQLKGAKEKKGQNDLIGTLITISALGGLVVGIAGALLCTPALGWLNTPAESWNQAGDYLIITCMGMVFVFIYNSISAVMRGMGDSKHPLIFVGIASVINIVLDIIFVGPLKMGARGAAIATVIAQAVSVVMSIHYLYRHCEAFSFDFKFSSFIPKFSWLKELARIGVPVMVQMSAITASLTYVMALVNAYGVVASATVGIGGKLFKIFCMPYQAMSVASTAMAGQNIGAKRPDRAKKVVQITLATNLAITAFAAFIIFVFPKQLVMIFDNSPDVIALCTVYLKIQLFNLFGHALFAYNAVCLGVGNALLSTIAFLTDGVVVRIALCYLFTKVLDWGLLGIFWGSALAPLSAGIILGVYYYSGAWRRFKPKALEVSSNAVKS